jgi:hypothetical protein
MLAAMRDAAGGGDPVISDPHCPRRMRKGSGMERTDWLDGGLDPAAARFLMMTAITHHQFSSPSWGEHEVRKLHAELAELDRLAAQAVVDHAGNRPQGRRANVRSTA